MSDDLSEGLESLPQIEGDELGCLSAGEGGAGGFEVLQGALEAGLVAGIDGYGMIRGPGAARADEIANGISQAIDPNGRVVTSLGFPEQGVFTATVGRNESLTVFTRIGWVTPWVVLAAAAICGVFLFLPSRKPAAGA